METDSVLLVPTTRNNTVTLSAASEPSQRAESKRAIATLTQSILRLRSHTTLTALRMTGIVCEALGLTVCFLQHLFREICEFMQRR